MTRPSTMAPPMTTVVWADLDPPARLELVRRPRAASQDDIDTSVRHILDEVRRGGDAALRSLTSRFDGVASGPFAVNLEEFAEAEATVPAGVKGAMAEARERLIAWHRAGMAREFEIETAPGVSCGRILRGIGRVGLYVPSGSAPLPSTALMLGVPASLAECREVVLCTPPRKDGRADPAILVAASLCGVRRVFKIGGAQAIAAMAFGTESVPACDKLFGPGNAYVTSAKQQVASKPGGPAIDMPAGPSEVMVIADDGARPAFVAADLLAQAEHGPDSQVILLTPALALGEAVRIEIEAQLPALPRAGIARQAMAHARIVVVTDVQAAVEISNDYAPEHLILAVRHPEALLRKVRAAGSVFLGHYAPETLGDYCSGTNHVLPTNGAARGYSGVSVASFQNSISVQSVSRAGLSAIGPCAVTLARAEGLEAHAQAVVRRLDSKP